jgi:hypothetical protein
MSGRSKKDKTQEKEVCTTNKGKEVKRYRSYFFTGKNYFHELKKFLSEKYNMEISQSLLQKYLWRMYQLGFFKNRKKVKGEHGGIIHTIYYDGVWLENADYSARKIRYLKYDKKGRKALENFSL